jgi:hypothetical protein
MLSFLSYFNGRLNGNEFSSFYGIPQQHVPFSREPTSCAKWMTLTLTLFFNPTFK